MLQFFKKIQIASKIKFNAITGQTLCRIWLFDTIIDQ